MKLTPNGQITIPPEICESLGISPETELEFGVENNRLYIQKKQYPNSIAAWITATQGTLQDTTTDEKGAIAQFPDRFLWLLSSSLVTHH